VLGWSVGSNGRDLFFIMALLNKPISCATFS
jgi:hypothetical protein